MKTSSGLQSANSMDSLETTPSEKEFKNHYPSLSLRRVKREGSVLGYRKLTDISEYTAAIIQSHQIWSTHVHVDEYSDGAQWTSNEVLINRGVGTSSYQKFVLILYIGLIVMGPCHCAFLS